MSPSRSGAPAPRSTPPAPAGARPTFGPELRRWRTRRRLSQLELAAAAEVSQRHLSFLETGRSKPSPEMVLHLGRALGLSLRDQNGLLASAGFAPVFAERGLDEPELDQVRHVLDRLLQAHDPYPAYVIDRAWDVVLVNRAAAWLIGGLDPAPPPEVAANAARLVFHPLGLRTRALNWEPTARVLLRRLERELAHAPEDARLQELWAEVTALPGVPDLSGRDELPTGDELVVPLVLDHRPGPGETDRLRFLTTVTTIGAAFDITLEELRLEMLLPVDAATEAVLRRAVDRA